MKKKASCLLIIIMIFFSLLSFSDESYPEESTFAFHGEEFFCINKAEDFKNSDIKGADFKIPSENSGVQYRYTRMKNEKIHYNTVVDGGIRRSNSSPRRRRNKISSQFSL